MKGLKLLVNLFIITAFFSNAFARRDIPDFTPNVVDQKNYLSLDEKTKINEVIIELQKSAGILSAVLIIEQLPPEGIESYAHDVFNHWGIGEKDKDNELLLLISMKVRMSRVEVGYGLESQITDAYSKRALTQVFAPNMREKTLFVALIEHLSF